MRGRPHRPLRVMDGRTNGGEKFVSVIIISTTVAASGFIEAADLRIVTDLYVISLPIVKILDPGMNSWFLRAPFRSNRSFRWSEASSVGCHLLTKKTLSRQVEIQTQIPASWHRC